MTLICQIDHVIYSTRKFSLGILKECCEIRQCGKIWLHKICQNTSFLWPVLSHIRIESIILSLYRKLKVRENLYSGIFTQCFCQFCGWSSPFFIWLENNCINGYWSVISHLNCVFTDNFCEIVFGKCFFFFRKLYC